MLCVSSKEFDQQRLYLVVGKIKETKPSYDGFLETNEHHKGRRYNDDERIGQVLLSFIFEECGFDLEKSRSRFLSLNSQEIEPYIKKAILESASADYYYTYEKDWGGQ